MKTKLNKIFYIYHEATLSVFFAGMAALEFICFLFIPNEIAYIALAGAICFSIVAFNLAAYVYRSAKRINIL
jgi:hypothetical protein